jgi:hypothetical protein
MITIAVAFSLTALCFGVLSPSIPGLWPYCIPVTLIAVLLWMHGTDLRNRRLARRIVRRFPDLLSAEERKMLLSSPSLFIPRLGSQPILFSGRDVTGIVQTAAVIAAAYGVLSALWLAWIPSFLGAGIFLYSLLGPLANAFENSNRADCMTRAADRCRSRLRRKDGTQTHEPARVSADMDICYWTTLHKLSSVRTSIAPGARRQAQFAQRWAFNPETASGGREAK